MSSNATFSKAFTDWRRARAELVRAKKRAARRKERDESSEGREIDLTVVERGLRQLRSVGDALAWKAFGYDRRIFIALSRNKSPGPMIGKHGLGYELGAVMDLWTNNEEFALLHDLTNCLRIADITHFTRERPILKEVKATRVRVPVKQMSRMQAAVDAINLGAPIKGQKGESHLFRSAHQFKSHLPLLREILPRADNVGVACGRISRQWVLSCFSTQSESLRKDPLAKLEKSRMIKSTAFAKAELMKARHHLHGVQLGNAASDPALAPIGIYPLDAEMCARLTCDYAIYESTLGLEQLAQA